MGKASRKKRAARTKLQISAMLKRYSDSGIGHGINFRKKNIATRVFTGGPVYRFLKNENYANDLVLGIVSLGTLEMCRAYEDPFQGDAKEAMHSYNSGIIIGDGSDTNFQKIARALQISVSEDCYDISFINTHSSRKIEDAYVICTSEFFIKEDFKESFGDYCVEISDPDLFYSLISEALEKIFIIKSSSWGAVQYRERHFEGLDDPNGMIGFIKPEKYDSQNEIRFLWECINKDRSKIEKLDRLNINIPGIRALCRRVL